MPSVVPQGYDVEDLWGLAHTEGEVRRLSACACLHAPAGTPPPCSMVANCDGTVAAPKRPVPASNLRTPAHHTLSCRDASHASMHHAHLHTRRRTRTAGKQQVSGLRQTLATAAQRTSTCCVCGAEGQPSVSHETSDDESHTLRFTLFPQLTFADRTVRLEKAGVRHRGGRGERGAFCRKRS